MPGTLLALAALLGIPGPGHAHDAMPEPIAFCRPVETTDSPDAQACACSVEQVEQTLTAPEFLRHVRLLRDRGAMTTPSSPEP